jgi:hypothetical protein
MLSNRVGIGRDVFELLLEETRRSHLLIKTLRSRVSDLEQRNAVLENELAECQKVVVDDIKEFDAGY